jgi:adenine-specific DNA-methyltransferase
MNNEKLTGSFYTPQVLVDYMVKYIKDHRQTGICEILEPSAGDGRFLSPMQKAFDCSVTAIEFDENKAQLIKNNHSSARIITRDFLDFAMESNNEYDIIIGNPPYINKRLMPTSQREKAVALLVKHDLSEELFQNMWVAFLVGALDLLKEGGVIFFVLPFEFLQVQYAETLRVFLESKFSTIRITTFEEKVFEGIEQDTCLVYLANETDEKAYVEYTTIVSPSNPVENFSSRIMRNKPIKKWSNCIINDDETELLTGFNQYQQMGSFGSISPGIVTGANAFFILDLETVKKLNLENEVLLPIVSKSNDLVKRFLFSKDDFNALSENGKKVWLLNLSKTKETAFPQELTVYLESGQQEEINDRFKCKHRVRWFDVPIVSKGSISFFKRYNNFPRMVVNSADVYTTDIAYNIRIREGIDAESLAFCFYNSLTLALCEYNGRFYGGGVGELVPSEFKELRIPYQEVAKAHIYEVDRMIRENTSFSLIIDYVDSIVLNIPKEQKEKLQDIRNRYIKRRLSK